MKGEIILAVKVEFGYIIRFVGRKFLTWNENGIDTRIVNLDNDRFVNHLSFVGWIKRVGLQADNLKFIDANLGVIVRL